MDHCETLCIKKEETDEVPNEPGSMVQVHPSSANIKEESEEGVNEEFLEDPLKIEVPDIHMKQDPELELLRNHCEDNFVEESYEMSCSPDFIREEPEVILEVDETENIVITSTRYETDSTRLIKKSGENCRISCEEPFNQEVFQEELENGTEESAHASRHGTPAQGLPSEEDIWKQDAGKRDGCNYGTLPLPVVDTDQTVELATERRHKCDICDMYFTQLQHVKRHQLKHTGVRPHKCDVCGKSFTQAGTLKRHMNLHTGEKPHKCDVCGKCFSQLHHMKAHAFKHTGVRPHKCYICGKCFTELVTLKKHLLIHTGERPYKCDICGKAFTQSCALNMHLLIHSGKRLFKCDVCGMSFLRLDHLKSHAITHTGMKPHKCITCNKSFTHLVSLKRHALIHVENSTLG